MKEFNFPHDFIYRHRRVFQARNFELFVFYNEFNTQNREALLSIFQGQRVDWVISDVNSWKAFIEREGLQPTGFQLWWPSKAIAASIENGELKWNYQYVDGFLHGHVADPLDTDIVESFCKAAQDLDRDVLGFVRSILEGKSRVLSPSEKETERKRYENWELYQTGDLGPLFRHKNAWDE